MKVKWLIIIALLFTCLSAAAAEPGMLYQSTRPETLSGTGKLDLISIFLIDPVPGNAIYEPEIQLITSTIHQSVNELLIYEIHDLNAAGREVWPADKLLACQEPACLVELGKQMGVEKILLGKVGKFRDNYSLSFSVFDVKKGDFTKSASKGCSCAEPQFRELLKQTINELLGFAAEADPPPTSNGTQP